ncbi:hypothetical protein COD67_22450 [Bacillus cereus]|nr:hypothetical protein COI89_09590 [Bacillus cereus]PGU62812.1 hypothetical protein COD67_22450 [Bacillus cereus]
MKIKVYVISAFVKSNSGGNLAGVVIHDEKIPPEIMQNIATRLGFSETAFISSSLREDRIIKYSFIHQLKQ